MATFESLVSQRMADADFRAALVADGPTLTNTEECELAERLRSLLALPAEKLLQRLLGGGPDGRPRLWDSYPPLAAYLE